MFWFLTTTPLVISNLLPVVGQGGGGYLGCVFFVLFRRSYILPLSHSKKGVIFWGVNALFSKGGLFGAGGGCLENGWGDTVDRA